MIKILRALALTLLISTSVSFAQGEYLGSGQSGFAVGWSYQSGEDASVRSVVGGACIQGKTDLTLAIGAIRLKELQNSKNLYSFRLRSFYKPKNERPSLLGSFDFTAQIGEVTAVSVGATGYGNLWVSRTSYIQLSFGPHLLSNPNNTEFNLMVTAGLSCLASISPHFAIAIEVGGAATSGRYATSSGGVGVNLVFPRQKSSKIGSW
jgi:hypothetical protein